MDAPTLVLTGSSGGCTTLRSPAVVKVTLRKHARRHAALVAEGNLMNTHHKPHRHPLTSSHPKLCFLCPSSCTGLAPNRSCDSLKPSMIHSRLPGFSIRLFSDHSFHHHTLLFYESGVGTPSTRGRCWPVPAWTHACRPPAGQQQQSHEVQQSVGKRSQVTSNTQSCVGNPPFSPSLRLWEPDGCWRSSWKPSGPRPCERSVGFVHSLPPSLPGRAATPSSSLPPPLQTGCLRLRGRLQQSSTKLISR